MAPHRACRSRPRFAAASRGADVFVEAPDGTLRAAAEAAADAAERQRCASRSISSRGGNARELKGKTLTLTLVGDAGATEATWTVAVAGMLATIAWLRGDKRLVVPRLSRPRARQ